MGILKKNICFLSKDKLYCQNSASKETKEVILSPYYYWYFQKKLPIANKKRASKIVPQMLVSSLPEEKEFEYILDQKEQKNYDIYVFDKKLFENTLSRFGVSLQEISHISFAHKEFEQGSFLLEGTQQLIHFADRCAELSSFIQSDLNTQSIEKWLENKESLKYKHITGKGSFLDKTFDFVENKFIFLVAIIFILVSAYGVELYKQIQTESFYQNKTDLLMKSQDYAQHQVQLKYIKDNLMDIYVKDKQFKTFLDRLSKLNGTKQLYVQSVEYNEQAWFLKIKAPSQKVANNFIKGLKLQFINEDNGLYLYEGMK